MQQNSPPRPTTEQFRQATAAEQLGIDAYNARKRFWHEAIRTAVDEVGRICTYDLDGFERHVRRQLAGIIAWRIRGAERSGDRATAARLKIEMVELEEAPSRAEETA